MQAGVAECYLRARVEMQSKHIEVVPMLFRLTRLST